MPTRFLPAKNQGLIVSAARNFHLKRPLKTRRFDDRLMISAVSAGDDL